jgi:hypothetical protein
MECLQTGPEETPGILVAATQRIHGVDRFTLNPEGEYHFHDPAGLEVPDDSSREKEHSTFDWEGPGCYHWLQQVFSGLFGVPAAGSPFTWKPDAKGLDAIQTYTFETGSDVYAEKAGYGVHSDFRMRLNKADVACSGGGFAQKIAEGITLTAAAADRPSVVIDPDKVAILVGDSVGGLAAIDWLEAEYSVAGRWAPHFVGGTASTSFKKHKKRKAQYNVQLVMEHDSASSGYLTALRAKATKYCRIRAQSAVEFSSGNAYDLQITFPFRFRKTPKLGNQDDVFGATWELQPIYLPTYLTTGGFMEIVLTNGTTVEEEEE